MDRPAHDLRAKSVRGGAWAALGAAGASGAGLVTFLVLSRLLGPEAYGLMAMVEAALALGQRLMASGLAEPLIQMPVVDDEHCDTLFWTLQIAGLLLAGITALLSTAIGAGFGAPGLPPLIAASAVSLYVQALGLVPAALLARRFGFRETAEASVFSEVIGGIVGIGLALSDQGVWALVVQRMVATAISTVVLAAKARWRPHFRFSPRVLRQVWAYSASRGLDGMLLYCDQQVPRILLGRVAGATELGYFVFARRIVENTVQVLTGPLRAAALSTFSALQHDLGRVRRAYAEGTGLTAGAALPASVGIALVAPYLVRAFAGRNWEPSILLLQLLVIASIRQSFHVWNGALLRGLGRPQLLLTASFVRTGLILLLIAVLLPWQAPGVAVATVAGSYLSWPVAMQFVRRASGMSIAEQLGSGKAPFLSTIFMAAVVLVAQWLIADRYSTIPVLLISILIGVLSYGGAMLVMGRSELANFRRNLGALRGRSAGSVSPDSQAE